MKIFLTGGTGFIGSHFINIAQNSGFTIKAHCRGLPETKIPLANSPQWIVKPLDQIQSQDLSDCDAIVHLASAGVSPQQATWPELMRWNVAATVNLLEQANSAKIRRVVMAGTFAEYGRAADLLDPIPPSAPLLPTYGYAASKAAAFMAAHAYAIENGMELAYLRIFSAFGAGQYEKNFWPSLRYAALQGADFPMTLGEQIRDYVPVDLVVNAFLNAVTRADISPGYPYVRNIGTGKPVTMREFAEYWWRQWNADGILKFGALPYRPNEVMRFIPEMVGDEF